MFLKSQLSRIRAAFSEHTEEEIAKPFEKVMGFFIKSLKIIGALPIGSASTGWKVQIRSTTFVYCAVVYCCGLGMSIITISNLVECFDKVPFEEKIFLQLLQFACLSFCWIPITTWPDSSSVGEYLTSWKELQEAFLRITQLPLIFDINNVARRTIYFSSFMFVQFLLVASLYPSHVPFLTLAAVSINVVYSLTIMFFWLISMIIVGNTGELLAASFKDTVESRLMSFQTMRDYHKLWIRLNDITTSTGHVLYRSYCLPLSLQICFLVLTLYAVVTFFVLGNHTLFVLYLTASVTTLAALSVFCNQGYYAPIKVKAIQNELHKLNFLNTNPKVLQEARRFLENIKMNPPLISLGGFIDINREMMSSACATLTTYLVVVLQFRLNQT